MNLPARRPEGRQPKRPDVCRLALLAGTALLLGACVNTRVEQSKNARTGIAAGESVVVLPTSYHKGNNTEDSFLECVNEELQSGRQAIRVLPQDAFRDALFPWFEPRTVPQGVESLPELLAKPGIARQVREQGIRYIVWVNGQTERSNEAGALSCAVSTVGGGCFGLLWWENEGAYKANVWDLRRSQTAGEVSSNARGTSMMPALVIPVPLIARTQTTACKNLAEELRSFIVNEGAS